MLDTHPIYIKVIDALIDNPDKKLKDALQPVLEDEFKKIRAIGVNIGWQAAWLRAYEEVKDMEDAEQIKARLREKADEIRERMGLKSAFDEDGNLIVDEGEDDDEKSL